MQQRVKWTVYGLLIVNFGFYLFDDWNRSIHVLEASSTVVDWAAEFATSIDEIGWFLLLLMFELETYTLSDESLNGWPSRAIRGVRLLCYSMIAYNIYALAVAVVSLQPTVQVQGHADLCEMAEQNVSYVYNLEYTAIDADSCATLPESITYFWVGGDPVVSSLEGLTLQRTLAWADLIDASVWLLIMAAIEIAVRLQGLGTSASRLILLADRVRIFFYVVLISLGIHWASLGHWLYFWDDLLWIGGFAVIGMNLSHWRGETSEVS
jgi:hypothetical protein